MLIVFGILFILASIAGIVTEKITEHSIQFCFACGLIFSAGVLLVVAGTFGGGPTAMDVYQGKTTLEITYKDGVAIDSVVVFKDKGK